MENIKLTVQMNAADQLAEPDQHATVVRKVLLLVFLTLQGLLYPITEFRLFFGE
jgi:hypothetical protein